MQNTYHMFKKVITIRKGQLIYIVKIKENINFLLNYLYVICCDKAIPFLRRQINTKIRFTFFFLTLNCRCVER